MMMRRRGSAPATVLAQQLHHFADKTASRYDTPRQDVQVSPDLIKDSHSGSWRNLSTRREESRSPSPLPPISNNYDYLERPESPRQATRSPNSPNLSRKPQKHRHKRRESEPMVMIGKDFMSSSRMLNSHSSGTLSRKFGPSNRDYSLVLLGQAGVGKSALLVRFCTGRFIHEYDPTLEMTYDIPSNIDEDPATLHITDTANTYEPVYLSQNEGFIVVYAIDEMRTFETAKQLVKLIREIKKQKGLNSFIVLAGNKCDLKHTRAVSRHEARQFAAEHECAFHETSAANNVNTKSIFHDSVRQIRTLHMMNKRANGAMNSLKHFFSKIN